VADQSTFEADITPHRPRLLQHAQGLTKDTDIAEDLLQEALLRAYERYHLYADGTNVRAWIMRIMTNLYINGYNKAKREPSSVSVDVLPDHLFPEDDEADDRFTESEVSRTVKQALNRLAAPYREAILLVDVNEVSIADASAHLGVPENTIKSRLRRGRRHLQQDLWAYAKRQGIT